MPQGKVYGPSKLKRFDTEKNVNIYDFQKCTNLNRKIAKKYDFHYKKNGSLKSNIQTANLFLEKGVKTPKH